MSSRVRLAGLALTIRTVASGGGKAAPVGPAPAPLGREASAATPKCVSAREPEGLRNDLSPATRSALLGPIGSPADGGCHVPDLPDVCT